MYVLSVSGCGESSVDPGVNLTVLVGEVSRMDREMQEGEGMKGETKNVGSCGCGCGCIAYSVYLIAFVHHYVSVRG